MTTRMIRRCWPMLVGLVLLAAPGAAPRTRAAAGDGGLPGAVFRLEPGAPDWVPGWARRVVWYQIFPERFRNGDPGNDPALADQEGAFPHDQASPWQVHPWTSDWYELQPYERRSGRDIWTSIQRRRYGGDLQGILDRLDYLQDLGVGAIYLNPIFEAPSHHKYDGATYHHVDPTFGPDPAGDRRLAAGETPADPKTWVWTAADRLFLKLLREAHRRNLRVILDGVFNHMGINSWAFRDVQARRAESPYRDWFVIKSFGEAGKTPLLYEGWFGVLELPELREDARGIVAGPREYIFAATRRWMDPDGDGDPADGIDGWRLDVAFCVGHAFWKDWRRHVRSINPEAYLTAEVVDTPAATAPYLEGDEFDAVMNYNFAFACADFFTGAPGAGNAAEFDRRLAKLRAAFPACVAGGMMNLLDSHDTNRVASHIVNRNRVAFRDWGKYFGWSKGDNPDYDTRAPRPEERRIQKLMAVFQFTYLGAPMVYYGDEAGLWGANDPCCRKPMLWPERKYAPERFRPDGTTRPRPDKVRFDAGLHRHYRQLAQLRNAHSALQRGDFRTILAEGPLFAFARSLEAEQIVVALNNSPRPQEVRLSLEPVASYKDLTGGRRRFQADAAGILRLTLPAWSAMVLGLDRPPRPGN